ncbi:hypothetical protein Tco_0402758, partial [Tanacetum coccineum]
VLLEQDELPSSVIRRRSDVLGFFSISVIKLASGRLVNGSSCDGSGMVIKDLDLEPKFDAMIRDFLD